MKYSLVGIYFCICSVAIAIAATSANEDRTTMSPSFKSVISYASGYDPSLLVHGSAQNANSGGTCSEFLALNRLNHCCLNRDDECKFC